MNKSEFVAAVAAKTEWSKAQAGDAVQAFLDCVSEGLKEGQSISFTGFGTFSVTDRAERQGRNPKTGESITIPAKKVVKFKPGKGLEL